VFNRGNVVVGCSDEGTAFDRAAGQLLRADRILKVNAIMLPAAMAVLLTFAASATASAKYTVTCGAMALGGAIWNETWEPETVVGANYGCKPSATHPYPVVLVHTTLAE
jgi:hypothetical protein